MNHRGLRGLLLTIGYQLGSGERPTEFTSPQGSQILIVNYKRMH